MKCPCEESIVIMVVNGECMAVGAPPPTMLSSSSMLNSRDLGLSVVGASHAKDSRCNEPRAEARGGSGEMAAR